MRREITIQGREEGGKKELRRIIVDVDLFSLRKIRMVRSAELLVVCRDNGNTARFTLENKREEARGKGAMEISADKELFILMMNPELTIVFRAEDLTASFSATGMMDSPFTLRAPLFDKQK